MYLLPLLLCLFLTADNSNSLAYPAYSTGMKCSYGERGSLTATCENATAAYIKQTHYRFDSLDETLICKNCNLGNIPSNAFDITGNQIATLVLRNSNIVGLSNAAFMGLIQMRVLDLSYNSIPSVAAGVFKGVKNVVTIDLSYNNIAALSKNGFSELGNLTDLELSNNAIKTIESGSFENLGKLNMLNLANNLITDLSDAFVGLKSLEHLILLNNSIETIRQNQINLTTLHNLDLSQNQIKNLSEAVFEKLYNLEMLNLSRNGLEHIDAGAFKGLRKLEYLDLESNNIKSIQFTTFMRLHNLRELHIPYNKLNIFYFPLFTSLPELRYLNVSHNQINGLKTGNVMKLYNVHTLDISFNNITYLDYKDLLEHAPRLVFINIDHNNLPCYIVEEMIDYFVKDNIQLSLDDKYDHTQIECNKTITKDYSLEAEMVKLEKLAKPEPPPTSGNIYVIYSLLCILAIIICFMGYIQMKIYRETIGKKWNDTAEVNLITSSGVENHDDY